MKTIMIINDKGNFSKRIKSICQDGDVTILNASTNRHALQSSLNNDTIDLFLIPTQLNGDNQGFFPCKSTDSLSTPLNKSNQILFEHCSSEELKSIIMNYL
jgi:hypothetical protein